MQVLCEAPEHTKSLKAGSFPVKNPQSSWGSDDYAIYEASSVPVMWAKVWQHSGHCCSFFLSVWSSPAASQEKWNLNMDPPTSLCCISPLCLKKNQWVDEKCHKRESVSDFSGNHVKGEMGWSCIRSRNRESFAEVTALMHVTVRGMQLVLEHGSDGRRLTNETGKQTKINMNKFAREESPFICSIFPLPYFLSPLYMAVSIRYLGSRHISAQEMSTCCPWKLTF